MRAMVLGLLAETFVHPGSGQTIGAVDLPVAREAATGYPVLAGSGLKGALKDAARAALACADEDEPIRTLFGVQHNAGGLLVSDARLLLLPVRCLTRAYAWLSCPLLLERYRRDRARAGCAAPFDPPQPARGEVVAKGARGTPVFLEERNFAIGCGPDTGMVEAVAALIPHDAARRRLAEQVAILHDDDFAWFAAYGLAVQARNVLDAKNKTSKNLWYEETLPPDTLMYAVIGERTAGALDQFRTMVLPKFTYLQAGGNETVGQGWFALRTVEGGAP